MTKENKADALKKTLKAKFKAPKKPSNNKKTKEPKGEAPVNQLEKPSAYAYSLIGQKTGKLMPLFEGLDHSIAKSGLKITFKAYISLTLLASLLVILPVALVLPPVMFYVFHMTLSSVLLFGVGGAMLAWATSVFGFYFYPTYLADKRKRDIEDEMPFLTGYMSILASAGVPPERMFQSIANLEVPLAASAEARDVMQDVNLFGLDIVSALQKTSAKTPSEKLQNVLQGVISTIHTGSNLGGFLRTRFKTAMRIKRLSLKKYSDNLAMLSELYVALLLTGPLMLAIMVSVMSVMGGGIGFLSPEATLNMLTFIGIPVCALIFLVILDSATPKW